MKQKGKQDDVFESLVPSLVARRGPNYVAHEQHERKNLTPDLSFSLVTKKSVFMPSSKAQTTAQRPELLVQFNVRASLQRWSACNDDTEFLRELLKKNMEKIGRERGNPIPLRLLKENCIIHL